MASIVAAKDPDDAAAWSAAWVVDQLQVPRPASIERYPEALGFFVTFCATPSVDEPGSLQWDPQSDLVAEGTWDALGEPR
jgi:hypothetical protein